MDLHNRFTERVRNVMRLAMEEAHRFKQPSFDTEHILLALLSDGSSVAAQVLRNRGLTPATIAMEVERRILRGTDTSPAEHLPRTAGVESVLENAVAEAHRLNHIYVGTEHILLGLLHERDGITAHVFTALGLSLEAAREETVRVLSLATSHQEAEQPSQSRTAPVSEADKQFFVRMYQSAVDFYEPKIEKRTGVRLGEIVVWEHSLLHQHVLRELKWRSSPWFVGIFRSIIMRRRLRANSPTLAADYADRARKCALAYFKNGIYVSFTSDTAHEHMVASGAVHELSHALWERLEEERLDEKWLHGRLAEAEREKFHLLSEGYASYAERVWFLDLYPFDVRKSVRRSRLNPESVHYKGFRRVQELVKEQGVGILMDMPKRWRDF
jgi:hypothetical protein